MRREPDFVVYNEHGPYLRRWFLIPRNPVFNIYLHEFVADDDDRALHDHPWWSLSLPISGGYWEWTQGGKKTWRKPWRPIFRLAATAHRIALSPDAPRARTIFLTGPRFRSWGFHCPAGWVHWREFVDDRDTGRRGRGCGEQS